MQSIEGEKSIEKSGVMKAEVTTNENQIIGRRNEDNTQKKTGLKLHTDVDPGYNSLDSDSGSPISSTKKKPEMKLTELNTSTEVKGKESNQMADQSIEQTLVDKSRRRAESVGEDPTTPVSFVQLHLDTGVKPKVKGCIDPKKDVPPSDQVKIEKQIKKEPQNDCSVQGKNPDDINALADKLKTNLVLIPKGIEHKRHMPAPTFSDFRQETLYAPMDHPFPPITISEGPTKPKKFIHVPGGGIVSPGFNLKQPSQVGIMPQNFQQKFQQPNMGNQCHMNMLMQAQSVPARDYDVMGWPGLQPQDDFTTTNVPTQFIPHQPCTTSYSTSLISLNNGNSGTVIIKQEPASPSGSHVSSSSHVSSCLEYDPNPEQKSEAINEIVKFLKEPGISSPVPSPGSPNNTYTQIENQQIYDSNLPETPPPSVGSAGSYDPTSPKSVTEDTMEQICNDGTMSAIMQCEQEVSRLSIECLLEQDKEDKDTCLHVVVTQGRYDLAVAIAKKLSKVPGALDVQNNLGQTPVFLATVVNMPRLVSELIAKGADPTIKDRHGCTPLHYAAMKGFTQIVRSIHIGLQQANRLEDFDVDIKDYEGKTPLHYAIEHHGKSETVFTAESQCATQVYVNNMELISMLLFMNASTLYQDGKSGKTPLHYVVENQKLDLIDMILDWDQDSQCVNQQTFNGCTPLHLAVCLKADESMIADIVRKLMRHGADVSKENCEKEKPIGLNPRSHSLVRNILSGRC